MSNEQQKNFELENDPVRSLLGGLKRVEAPGDFDFRVKARIASGRPIDRSAPWLPAAARLAMPLALLLVIGGFFGYNALYPTSNVAIAPVVEMQSALPIPDRKPAQPAPALSNEVVAKVNETKPAVTDSTIAAIPTEKRTVVTEPANKQPGGGSVDRASSIAKTVPPKDSDTNRTVLPKDKNESSGVSARDILSRIGVGVDPSWKVGSVKQNSMADRSGLKAGDVVEAIDGQNVNDETTFENKSTGKSVRVRRGGASVQIDLKH
jgi:hypothetical protein